MRARDVDPKIRRFFPWALFLALATLLALGAMIVHAHGEEDVYACYGSSRYQAMSDAWPACDERTFCDKVKFYLQTHTEAEARAVAVEKHLPQWIVRKAERCVP